MQMHQTPNIELDDRLRRLSISGRSFPEHAADFYAPMFSWLEHYLDAEGGNGERLRPLTVHIELEAFNSSSAKVLMDLFDRLERSAAAGREVVIEWAFDHNNLRAMQSGDAFAEAWAGLGFVQCTSGLTGVDSGPLG